MAHVAPHLPERAMVVVFNPLDVELSRTLRVPLWAAGLAGTARVAQRVAPALEPGPERELPLAGDGTLVLEVTVPAGGLAYVVVR